MGGKGQMGGIGVLAVATLVAGPPAAAAQRALSSTALPAPVRAACNLAQSLAGRTAGVSIRRSTGLATDETLDHPVRACRLAISGSFKRAGNGPDAALRLRDGFEALGWTELGEFSADGKDGTSFAFRKDAVGCFARGEWNGGADGEPEIPAQDWYRVSVFCTTPPPVRSQAR